MTAAAAQTLTLSALVQEVEGSLQILRGVRAAVAAVGRLLTHPREIQTLNEQVSKACLEALDTGASSLRTLDLEENTDDAANQYAASYQHSCALRELLQAVRWREADRPDTCRRHLLDSLRALERAVALSGNPARVGDEAVHAYVIGSDRAPVEVPHA